MEKTPETQEVDLTKLVSKKEDKVNILPAAILAAKAMNKKNSIGIIEVELPVLNIKVKCFAMSGVDDLTIKTITGSVSAYTDLNFQLLYKHLEFPKDHPIKDYETFKVYFTEADFRMALYGVMLATFLTLEESKFVCRNEKCTNPDPERVYSYAIKMKDLKVKYQKDHYISPNGDHTLDIFIAENDIININYKFENIDSKINLFNTKTNDQIRNNILTYSSMVPKTELVTSYIDSVVVSAEGENYQISNPNEILMFLNSLSLTSKEEIEKMNNKFVQHIDSWIPTFSTELVCPHCGNKHEWEDIDIYVEFFRKFSAIFQ